MKRMLPIVLLALTACTNSAAAERAVKAQGMHDFESTGYRFWSCGKGYKVHTGFRAKTADGTEVTGTACSGLVFTGTTLKMD